MGAAREKEERTLLCGQLAADLPLRWPCSRLVWCVMGGGSISGSGSLQAAPQARAWLAGGRQEEEGPACFYVFSLLTVALPNL